LEIEEVVEVYDEEVADTFGLFPGQLAVQIHSGSRGLGHQVCTDYVRNLQKAVTRYGIKLPDRELVCAPLDSPEGRDYFAAMAGAANYAWANRQCMAYLTRRTFEEVLAGKVTSWELSTIYDVAHNIAKIEEHELDGRRTKLCVHRKGATRAFGPGQPELPGVYRVVGQPVLVPGDMGTASYVLVGTEEAMKASFGSTCHGAGRVLSRKAAKRKIRGDTLKAELEAQGIQVRAGSMPGLAEEAPAAYKDIERVVDVVHRAGLARKVAKLRPLAVMKG
jgi:tRNA-splicing ligase RtcB